MTTKADAEREALEQRMVAAGTMRPAADTAKVRARILDRAEERLEGSQKTLDEFAAKFKESPLEALTWRTEDVVRDQTLRELAANVQTIASAASTRTDAEVFEAVVAFFDRMQARAMELARGLRTSTNVVANEIERVQMKTLAEAVYFGGWLFNVAALAKEALEESKAAAE